MMHSNKEPKQKSIWIIDHYSSEPQYGGISRQYDFAIELAKQGYRVVIVSSAFSHFTYTYITEEKYMVSKVNDNVYYVYLKTSEYKNAAGIARMKNIASFLFAVLRQFKQIERMLGQPDVVEGCSIHPLSWIAAYKIAKHYDVRFCAEVRDLWPEMWLLNGEKSFWDPMVLFFGAIERWAYRRADKVIYSMVYGDKYIHGKLGFPREKIELIGQPMDCDRFDYNAEHKKDQLSDEIIDFIGDSFLCVFAGYYMEYEGVYVMLEAARMLQEKKLPIRLIFVGSGKEKEGMQSYVNDNQLKNTLVWGRIGKEAVPALLRRADICLAHCSTKGHDNSFKYGVSKNKVNEYMYSNSCVIYGFTDTQDAVAKSGAGYVIKPFDAFAFAEKIEAVFQMPSAERSQFGKCGKRYIEENHKVQLLARKLLKVFFE